MPPLPTVVLRHTPGSTPDGVHHDWLMAVPSDPDGPLWAARILPPPADWLTLGTFSATPLPPHRRLYLTYEGPLDPRDGKPRGHVTRVDQGTFTPLLWSPDHIRLDLHLTRCTARVDLVRSNPDLWSIQVNRPPDVIK